MLSKSEIQCIFFSNRVKIRRRLANDSLCPLDLWVGTNIAYMLIRLTILVNHSINAIWIVVVSSESTTTAYTIITIGKMTIVLMCSHEVELHIQLENNTRALSIGSEITIVSYNYDNNNNMNTCIYIQLLLLYVCSLKVQLYHITRINIHIGILIYLTIIIVIDLDASMFDAQCLVVYACLFCSVSEWLRVREPMCVCVCVCSSHLRDDWLIDNVMDDDDNNDERWRWHRTKLERWVFVPEAQRRER